MKISEYKNLVAAAKSEDEECFELKLYLDDLVEDGKLQCYTHIANETYTKYWSVKVKNKKLGVKPGVPDYLLVGNKSLMFLEMKRKKGGKISVEQEKWLDAILTANTMVFVGLGFEDGKAKIEKWLEL